LIASAQAVEHYEIARYGTLIAWASQLDMSDAASLLEETLAEEKAADEKLSSLAEKDNPMAVQGMPPRSWMSSAVTSTGIGKGRAGSIPARRLQSRP